MTFYSVIFAILFGGAFKELLLAIGDGNWANSFAAGTLSLLMFNDATFTSWAVEQVEIRYKYPLMLLDAINFVIVSVALLLLDPQERNLFGANLTNLFGTDPKEFLWLFWLLLALYWSVDIRWCGKSRIYQEANFSTTHTWWLGSFAILLVAVFVVQAAVMFCSASVEKHSEGIVAFIASVYHTGGIAAVIALVYLVYQYRSLVKWERPKSPGRNFPL